MNGKTKSYNSLSFNWAYLLSQQKILYFSVSNVLGSQNVFGYEYANNPDNDGFYKRKEIIPTADRCNACRRGLPPEDPERLHLFRDGILGRRGNPKHAASSEEQETCGTPRSVPRRRKIRDARVRHLSRA